LKYVFTIRPIDGWVKEIVSMRTSCPCQGPYYLLIEILIFREER